MIYGPDLEWETQETLQTPREKHYDSKSNGLEEQKEKAVLKIHSPGPP